MNITAESIDRQLAPERIHEQAIDRIVLMVAFPLGVLTLFAIAACQVFALELRGLWPAYFGREEALWSVGRVALGTVLAFVAIARMPFEPRWLLLGLPAAALVASANGIASVISMSMSIVGGLTLGYYLRLRPKLHHLRAHPELHARRLLLPLLTRETSPLMSRPVADVLAALRRRSNLTNLALGLLGLGAAALYARETYQPSLAPTIERYKAAWKAGDVQAISALAVDSNAGAAIERELEAFARTGAIGWPPIVGLNIPVGPESRAESFRLPQGEFQVWRVTHVLEGQASVESAWVHADGRWSLVSLSLRPRG
jgi:hypothetical protein